MTGPIDQTVADWHRFLAGDFPGGLDELLHDDVVFLSPIVFTPQAGKELTRFYLRGASASFGGDDARPAGEPAPTSFHYVKEVVAGDHAVLEFEAEVDGIVVNGVDILTVDDDGKIVEFKVMLRPLKAIELMHQKMREALERLSAAGDAAG
jgi:hypothetical protein